MGYISSIYFEKSIAINCEHNDRTMSPSYLIDTEKGAECNRNAENARALKNQIIAKAKENYTQNTGQKFQAKSYEWSAVCNIKPESTMQDLEKLAEHFEKKYGFQCYQIAIHRDEGHENEQGEIVPNLHAHLEFITLDRETGKQNFKMRDFPKEVMREIQTETAEILQMQRGQDKRLSGAKRVKPREYARQKEAEKEQTAPLKKKVKELETELESEKLSKKQIKEAIEAERKKMADENKALKEANENAIYNADDYKKLRELNQQQFSTITELNAEIERIKTEAQEREAKINELESDLKAEQEKNKDLYSQIREIDLNATQEQENTISELKQENKDLRQELNQTWEAKEAITKGKYEDKPTIAQTILSDYNKAKSDAIKRATSKSGIFGKETVNYETAFNSFVESMDKFHNAVKKTVLGDPLDYYERENSVIKHIKSYLEKSRNFANDIFNDIRKKKDEIIENLKLTIKGLKSKVTDLENENGDLKQEIALFNEFHKANNLDIKFTNWQFENSKGLFANKQEQKVEKILTENDTTKTRKIRTIHGTKTIKDDGLSL